LILPATFGLILLVTTAGTSSAQQPPHTAAEVRSFVLAKVQGGAAAKGRPLYIEIPTRDSLARLIHCRPRRPIDSLDSAPCHMVGIPRNRTAVLIGDVSFTDSVTAKVPVGFYGEDRRGASADQVTWVVQFADGRWFKVGETLHIIQ
jgi:hypothetical protein